MGTPEIHVDVLIFGGGIAGLWTLARLRREGYSCLLLESRALGAGQTIASQGIIHGGVKYAVGGEADPGAAIAKMPGIWRACLRGEGEIDLRGVRVLSEHQYLWTAPGLMGRIAGVGASLAMRADVRRVAGDDAPEVLRGGRGVDVYRVDEPVLDPHSLVVALADAHRSLVRAYVGNDHVRPEAPDGQRTCGAINILNRPGGDAVLRIVPGFVLLAAGAGNDELMRTLQGVLLKPTQRRPLHMVMARGLAGPVYGHCLGGSTLPRLTITSSRGVDGSWVWYIGGALAEAEGVAREREAQIAAARGALAECLPWVDLSGARFATMRIDRSEAVDHVEHPARRPDEPVVVGARSFACAWATKLAFAPLVVDRVLEKILACDVRKSGAMPDVPPVLKEAPIAELPWDRKDLAWS